MPSSESSQDVSSATNHLIQMSTGKMVDILNLTEDKIDIKDICSSLSKQCRFMGHGSRFYSVAEHCYRMSYLCDPKYAFEALLHDASEAYLCDLPRPIKTLFPLYVEIEEKIQEVISKKWKLTYPFPQEIHLLDLQMSISEADLFMEGGTEDWSAEILKHRSERNLMEYVPEISYSSRTEDIIKMFDRLYFSRFQYLLSQRIPYCQS